MQTLVTAMSVITDRVTPRGGPAARKTRVFPQAFGRSTPMQRFSLIAIRQPHQRC